MCDQQTFFETRYGTALTAALALAAIASQILIPAAAFSRVFG